MTVSILEKATAALLTKNPQELKVVAASLLALARKGNSECAAPFFIVADALSDAAARVAAYRDAANYAGSGSALEQQAQKKLKELLQPEPARPAKAEIAAFVARFGAKAQN
jgi:hypothetical protein